MATLQKIMRNHYRDSVSLMQLSSRLVDLSGVVQASAVMATDSNLALLKEAGLLEGKNDAGPNDLLIVIQGDDEALLERALAKAEDQLNERRAVWSEDSVKQRIAPRSIEMGLNCMAKANLALISVPGEYAGSEALKALHLGLHVMLFSSNVDLSEEIQLKKYARDHDLIVMGPDCGSAIINGIPLGFANVVRRGDIGCVAASGSGLQQVTSLIDRAGEGISQAIGTGGRDLHVNVGGISMSQGLETLAEDPATKVIVLISKPPAPEVSERVLEKAARVGKPVVVSFLGVNPASVKRPNVFASGTLEEAANMAVALSQGKNPDHNGEVNIKYEIQTTAAASKLSPEQKFIRGLYSGGTLGYEAVLLLNDLVGPVNTNTPMEPKFALADVWQSKQHTVIDLGDGVFTRGRPHPMIDHRLRNERILREAADSEVAVILLDVILGYGSHIDPASVMIPVIDNARKIAARASRQLVFVGSVCGTSSDPQGLSGQESALRNAGMILTESNAQAVRLAAKIVRGR